MHRLDPGSEKEEVRWRPRVGVGRSPNYIPQLDGCGKKDGSSEDDSDVGDECCGGGENGGEQRGEEK